MGLFTPIWMTDKKEKVPKAVAYVEKVRAAALVEDCTGGSNYALTDAKPADAVFQRVVGMHTPIMRELENVLPDNPEGLRTYIVFPGAGDCYPR